MSEPDPNARGFRKATVYARKIDVKDKLVTYGTHRMRRATLDYGYIIIEEYWDEMPTKK